MNNDEIQIWEPLLKALRSELQEHGELFQKLTEQQQSIFSREPHKLMEINLLIREQSETCERHRNIREKQAASISAILGAGTPQLSKLIAHCPPAINPLLQALIDELTTIAARLDQKTRQNRMLLQQAVEVTEELLLKLNPEDTLHTYTASGTSKTINSHARADKAQGRLVCQA